jgi:hypothetical protein
MENLGIFYDHLGNFTAIGNILWPFGIFCGHLVHFSPFWCAVPRKIWQPCDKADFSPALIYAKPFLLTRNDFPNLN